MWGPTKGLAIHLALWSTLLAVAGCSAVTRDASCERVAARALVHFPPVEGEDPELRRQGLVTRCEQQGWSAEGRACLANAPDGESYVECARAEKVRLGKDMGGPACDDVMAKLERFTDPTHRAERAMFCRTMTAAHKRCVMAIPDDADQVAFFEAYAACSRAANE